MRARWTTGPLTHAALSLAAELFATKTRKVSDTPYLSHLLAVSALVMEHGGSEVQAAAGLLHDAIEDTKVTAYELSQRLIQRGASQTEAAAVADIVVACTDGTADQKRDGADWVQRKKAYLATLSAKSAEHPAMLVSLADKVHNIEGTLREIRGGSTAAKFYDQPGFNAGAPLQKWYYSSLAHVFRDKLGGNAQALRLVRRLEAAVDEIFADVEAARP